MDGLIIAVAVSLIFMSGGFFYRQAADIGEKSYESAFESEQTVENTEADTDNTDDLYAEYLIASAIYNAADKYMEKLHNDEVWRDRSEIKIDDIIAAGMLDSYPIEYFQTNTKDLKINAVDGKIDSVTWTSENGRKNIYPRPSYTGTAEYKTAEKIFNAAQAYADSLAEQDKWFVENNAGISITALKNAGFLDDGNYDGYYIQLEAETWHGGYGTKPKVSYIYWKDETGLIYSYPEKSHFLEP